MLAGEQTLHLQNQHKYTVQKQPTKKKIKNFVFISVHPLLKFKNIPQMQDITIYSFYSENTRTLTYFNLSCGSSLGAVNKYLYKM